MIKLLIGLWGHFESKRRRQIGIVVILTILASFAEVISIAAIIPFLGVLVTPEKFIDNKWAGVIVETFNLSSQDQIILPITIIFTAFQILIFKTESSARFTFWSETFSISGASFSLIIFNLKISASSFFLSS